MHILANGAGRNLRSTIMNHLKIRIMKEQILKKIGKTLVRINVTDQSAEDAYDEAALACLVCFPVSTD